MTDEMSSIKLSMHDLCDSNLWVEHRSPDEKLYYYNPKSRMTRWEKPRGKSVRIINQQDFETNATEILRIRSSNPCDVNSLEPRPVTISLMPPASMALKLPIPMTEDQLERERDELEKAKELLKQNAASWSMFTNPDGVEYYYNSSSMTSQWHEPHEIVVIRELEKRFNEINSVLNQIRCCGLDCPNEDDLSRPSLRIPIKGSPWCVVWLTSAKCFFFNPTTKRSVWKMPEELAGRDDVEQIIANPPEPTNKSPDRRNQLDQAIFSLGEDECKDKKLRLDEAEEVSNADNDIIIDKSNLSHEERIKHFREMLHDKKVSVFSDFEDQMYKLKSDPRYVLLNAKERRTAFDSFLRDRIEQERKEKTEIINKKKTAFIEMLREAKIKHSAQFCDLCKSRISRDPRFRAVEKMRDREQLFNSYIEAMANELRNDTEQAKKRFVEFLIESLGDVNSKLLKTLTWKSAKDCLNTNDERYSKAGPLRERWFCEYLKSIDGEEAKDSAEDRISRSLRKREEQVRNEMELSKKEIQEERVQHLKNEAFLKLKSFLVDTVKNDQVKWKEVKTGLRKSFPKDTLTHDEIKSAFRKHIEDLRWKLKSMFKNMLEESKVTIDSNWRDVKKHLRADARYKKLSRSSCDWSNEFDEYKKELRSRAFDEFKELLEQTKQIDHKTLSQISDGERSLFDVECLLANDKRYIVFGDSSSKRTEMLLEYLKHLEARGPPPPPTASDTNSWKRSGR